MKKLFTLMGLLIWTMASIAQVQFPNKPLSTKPGELLQMIKRPNADRIGSYSHYASLASKSIQNPSELHLDSILADDEVKIVFEYDALGRVINQVYWEYFEGGQQWDPDYREAYTYNAAGYIESRTEYYWEDEEWTPEYLYEIEYNSNGDFTLEVYSSYDEGSETFAPGYKAEHFYDSNFWLDSTYNYDWNIANSNWQLNLRTAYINNAYGDPTNTSLAYYDNINAEWIIYNQTNHMYQYDASDRVIEEVIQNWDMVDEIWMNNLKRNYGYLSNGLESIYSESYWEESQSIWSLDMQEDYTYDENENMSSRIYSSFNSQNSSFEATEKEEMVFDLTKNASDYAIPAWILEEWHFNNIMISLSLYEKLGSNWAEYATAYFYYTIPNNISNMEQERITLFPNPIGNDGILRLESNLGFSGSEVFELYDTRGRLLQFERLEGNTSINLEEIESGIYFYRIHNSSSSVLSGKLIKP